MVNIYIIYAEGCEECDKAQREIDDAISEGLEKYNMHLHDIEDPDSLEVAIRFNLGGDIPSCVIEGEVGEFKALEGKKITKKRVLKAIQKLSK
jgi:hypothetical protein